MSLPAKNLPNNTCNQNLMIVGAGAWGSALSIALSCKFKTIYLLCQDNSQTLNCTHPALQVQYSDNTQLTADYSKIAICENILIATPSYAFSIVLDNIVPFIKQQNIAWVTKGFYGEKLLHQTFSNKFPNISPCLISGPSFASEVASLKPTALVVASPNKSTAVLWANLIKSSHLKIYISDDIVGCEVGGAVKNIIAIAAGISYGLGFGTNAISALISRGLAEMVRFGVSIGGSQKTFMGLTGLGDLTLTCFDDLSRNRSFGKEISKNPNVDLVLKKINATVEGLNALPVVLKIAKENQVQMPICEMVQMIISGKILPKDAVNNLMNRDINYE